jgi:4-hydroxy-tetrahydrodipicolinate synthase
MSLEWEGVFCALWTPTDESGQLIESALRTNLEFLKVRGVQGVLALGSTGEFLHLEFEVRKRLIERVVALAGPLRVMMNISEIRPAAVADLARFARQAGAAAVSLLPPYFYPVAQEDLVEFFVRGGAAAELPLFLYNFPERTGNRIDLETVAAVADRVRVSGVKQSGNEFGYHAPLVELGRRKDFVVLTGADTRLPEAVSMGVVGCVSGLANAVPELVVESLADARKGRPGEGMAAKRLDELGRRISAVNFPLNVAAVMEARGMPTGCAKSLVSAGTKARIAHLVGELRELFGEWKLV